MKTISKGNCPKISGFMEWNKVRMEMIETIRKDVEEMTPAQLERVNDLVHKIREEEYEEDKLWMR